MCARSLTRLKYAGFRDDALVFCGWNLSGLLRHCDCALLTSLPSVGCAGGQWFAVEGVAVESFGAEVQVGGAEFFGLA